MKKAQALVALLLMVLAYGAQGQTINLNGAARTGTFEIGDRGPRLKQSQEIKHGDVWGVTIPALPDGVTYSVFVHPDDQFFIDVPEGAQSLLIEIMAEDIDNDYDIFVRFGEPVEPINQEGVEADRASRNDFGWEEVIFRGDNLVPGRYYICLASGSSMEGTLLLRALIDTTIFDLEPEKEAILLVSADDDVPGNEFVEPDAHQFRFPVPLDAESILVRFESLELAQDTVLAFSWEEPSTLTDEGLLSTDFTVDAAGGYEEVCFTDTGLQPGEDLFALQPGEDLFIWVLNNSGGEPVIAALLVEVNGCATPITIGETKNATAMGPKEPDTVLLGSRQYVVTVDEPTQDLTITVTASGDAADLNLYLRKDLPVGFTPPPDSVLLADFTSVETGTDPEILTITCDALEAGDYYICLGNAADRPVPYTITVSAEPCQIEAIFKRGDSNGDGTVNIADAIYVLQHLFAEGPPSPCIDAADSNDDEGVNIADAVYTLQNLFASGPPIPAPGPTTCGPDPTPHPTGGPDFGCESYTACN